MFKECFLATISRGRALSMTDSRNRNDKMHFSPNARQTPDSYSTNRRPHPGRVLPRSWTKTIGEGLAICAVVGVISDLLAPIGNGEVLNYILVATAALLTSALIVWKKFEQWRQDTAAVIAALGIGLLSFGGLKIAYLAGYAPNGFIAENSELARDLQTNLLGIERELITIGAGLGRVEEGVGRVEAKTETIQQTATRIEVDTKGSKRETSQDPRKELANRGIPWNNDRFKEALRSEDTDTIKLFVDGGFKWTRAAPRLHLMLAISSFAEAGSLQALASDRKGLSKVVCKPPFRIDEEDRQEICYDDFAKDYLRLVKLVGRGEMTALCGVGALNSANQCLAESDVSDRQSWLQIIKALN